MEASTHTVQRSLKSRTSSELLALITACLFLVIGEADSFHLIGDFGGNVTFRCTTIERKPIKFFYLQRDMATPEFVNGFYINKSIQWQPWKNTEVYNNKAIVHMYNLNMSHSGNYECVICYTDSDDVHKEKIRLNVTAKYSTPTVSVSYDDKHHSCYVTCSVHGGYPAKEIKWDVPGNNGQMWNVVNNSDKSDPDTKLVNISSTAFFNSSYGGFEFVRCSVGSDTSSTTACIRNKPAGPSTPEMLLPICVVAIVVVALVLILGIILWRRSIRQPPGQEQIEIQGTEQQEPLNSGQL
ncbi:uncharacterized protein ACBR49_004624 isoform 2-T2 [Aulostomus maculatus]